MGIFKKIFKGVKNVFKKVGKGIKKVVKGVGKVLGKVAKPFQKCWLHPQRSVRCLSMLYRSLTIYKSKITLAN